MIEVSHIAKTYMRGDGTPVPALKDLSFTIANGEFVTIRGASGSGKSSLLNIIGCLDTPTSGTYRLAGEDVSHYTDQQRSHIRNRKIGFVFQSFNLLPRTTAVENVEIPALYMDGKVDRGRALSILDARRPRRARGSFRHRAVRRRAAARRDRPGAHERPAAAARGRADGQS